MPNSSRPRGELRLHVDLQLDLCIRFIQLRYAVFNNAIRANPLEEG